MSCNGWRGTISISSSRSDWTPLQRQFLAKFFTKEVLPVLTPLGVEELSTCPLLPGLQLCVGAAGGHLESRPVRGQKLVVIPVPVAFNRFVNIPTDQGTYVAPLEEVILDHARTMFGGREIRGHAVFRITRDADIAVQDDEAADLLSAVQDAVVSRRRRSAVRLEISAHPDPYIVRWLTTMLDAAGR